MASGVEDARFNYVWVRDNDWSEGGWDSTVNSGNPPTKETEWDFTPRVPGTYELYVDLKRASGSTVITKSITLKVVEEWKVDSLSVPSAGKTLHMGDPIQVDVKVSGADADAARFNYVWVRDNDWSAGSWDSTINATGASTAETSWTFTPSRPGSYAIYIDTIRADGTKTTSKAYGVTVREDWAFDGFDLSARAILLGEPLEVTAKASGVDADYARFNYVWNYRGDWSEWSSVELETGAPTSSDTWTFTPKRSGTYEIYVDAVRTDGSRVTKASSITVESSWAAEGLVLTSNGEPLQGGKVVLGAPLEASFDMEDGSNLTGLTYNFVWQRGTSWASGEWDSTVNRTGSNTKDASWTFTPEKCGTYRLYVDFVAADGTKETLSTTLEVDRGWSSGEITIDKTSPQLTGTTLTIEPNVSGESAQYVRYNYVWQRDGWAEWNSSLNASGGTYHPTDTGTWVIGASGWYSFYVDVVDQFGETETMQVEGIRGYSVSDTISSIERCLAGGWDSSGWKYENDLLIAGGSLCNGRHGWWCANYLWWGFRQAGFSDLWGNGSLQVDPGYVANECQWLGRYHWGTAGVRRGDILFSYMAPWRAGQTITHAAYVVSVSGSSVTVVEGNAGWSNYRTYSLWDPIFKGYARPAY